MEKKCKCSRCGMEIAKAYEGGMCIECIKELEREVIVHIKQYVAPIEMTRGY